MLTSQTKQRGHVKDRGEIERNEDWLHGIRMTCCRQIENGLGGLLDAVRMADEPGNSPDMPVPMADLAMKGVKRMGMHLGVVGLWSRRNFSG